MLKIHQGVKESERNEGVCKKKKKKKITSQQCNKKMNGMRGESEGENEKKESVKVKHVHRDQCADFSWQIQGSARLKALQAHSSKW